MAVSESDVRHIAALARLAIPDNRVPVLVRELNGILAHIDALQAVNLDNTLPALSSVSGMPLREDVANPVTLERAREDFAPSMRDGFFLVPRLETHGSSGADAEDEA